MYWRNGFVSLLSCAVPKLVSYLKLFYLSVVETKIIADSQYCILQKWITYQSLYQRCFPSSTRPHKTHLNVLVNFFCIFFQYLHQWVVYGVVLVLNYETVANTTFCNLFKTILTNGMSAWDYCRFSRLCIVSEKTTYTLHWSILAD